MRIISNSLYSLKADQRTSFLIIINMSYFISSTVTKSMSFSKIILVMKLVRREKNAQLLSTRYSKLGSCHRCNRLLKRCNVKCAARILFGIGGALFVSGVFGCFWCEGVRESTKTDFISFLLSPSHRKQSNTPDTNKAPPLPKCILADRLVRS